MCDALILISTARHSGHNRVHNFHRTQKSGEQTVVQQPHASAFPSLLLSLLSISFPFCHGPSFLFSLGALLAEGAAGIRTFWKVLDFYLRAFTVLKMVSVLEQRERKDGKWISWGIEAGMLRRLASAAPPLQQIVGSGPGPVYIDSMRPD